jgi:hypothetical protein
MSRPLEVQEDNEREALRVKMQLHALERDFDRESQKNQARDGRKGGPRAQGTSEKKKVENCTKAERERERLRLRRKTGEKCEREEERKQNEKGKERRQWL